jgi:hypothetical protein
MVPKEFNITGGIYKTYVDIIYNMTRGWEFDDYRFTEYEFEEIINKDTGSSFGYDISTSFDNEYNEFVEEKKYFIGCPFKIYESTYPKRLNNYITVNNQDMLGESHFVKAELRDTLEYNVDSILEKEIRVKLKKSISRRKEFLIEKFESLGFIYKVRKNENGKIVSLGKKGIKKVIEQESALDLSDTSLTEKIIYLKLLGVYDYLVSKEPFNMSKNSLASIISAITGGKATSVQSAINPIDNPSASQKNNPLENDKKVLSIKLKLDDLGFK